MLVTAALMTWLGPSGHSYVAALRHPQRFVDTAGADTAALTVIAGLCWLTLTWLAIGLGFAAASGLPGVAGRVGRAVAHRTLPAALRRLAVAAVGVSIATSSSGWGAAAVAAPAGGPAVGHPAWSAGAATSAALTARPPAAVPPTRIPASPPAARRPATPVLAAAQRAGGDGPALDWPTDDSAGGPDRPASPASAGVVIVRPGDTLWGIAAARLGPGATPADIAAAWPRWYQANRSVIGGDPDLILPGQRLVPPANDTRASTHHG